MSTPEMDSSTDSAGHQQRRSMGEQAPLHSDDHTDDAIQLEDRTSCSPPPSTSSPRIANPTPTSDPKSGAETGTKRLEVYCQGHGTPEAGGTARNLVVCIDGTANQFGFKNSNVVELYSRLVKNRHQLTYHNSGVGTYVKESNRFAAMKQGIANGWDMAVACNLKKIILNAYRWLSDNYQPGDLIFLFGFSRGAYQVRIIAGMITTVGLLHKGNDDQIVFAYELYLANIDRRLAESSWRYLVQWFRSIWKTIRAKIKRREPSDTFMLEEAEPSGSTRQSGSTDIMQKVKDVSGMFKQTLSHEHTTVHLVGVWDTVSSVGITRGQSFPETVHGMTNVCGCRHAVSLDERRDKFQPEYINGGAGPAYSRDLGRHLTQEERESQPGGLTRAKEVWFVGSHSDIGGGNSENIKLNSFGPSLRWMLYESLQYGLMVKLDVKGWGIPEHKPSMTKIWRILEIYPFRRLTYQHPDKTKRWPPHLSRGRRMQPGQLIHESVIKYMKEQDPGYTPAARGPRVGDGDDHVMEWAEVRESVNNTSMCIEKDGASPALEILTQLRDAACSDRGMTESDLQPLLNLILRLRGGSQSIIDTAGDGARLLGEVLQHTVKSTSGARTDTLQDHAVRVITTALALFPATPSQAPEYFVGTLEVWLHLADPEARKKIVKLFGTNALQASTASVSSVTYSLDGRYLASGSWDNTVQIRDTRTGDQIGRPLRGHTHQINSVAFSPDGAYIASASGDTTIRVWDVATQRAVGLPLAGHTRQVFSIAFSPDGKHIVSGSVDETVRIWEVKTGRAVGEPLRGHAGFIRSVALSPDGRYIASGASDDTVRIWNFETREVVRVLQGHSDWVRSVVFTPDGKRVVSGARDSTIRVWDTESGSTVLGPLRGHKGGVYAVSVSKDGKCIASGSQDKTVRLWDAETGEAVGKPLRGHTQAVYAVAFSPHGRRVVVSASEDTSLRFWNV